MTFLLCDPGWYARGRHYAKLSLSNAARLSFSDLCILLFMFLSLCRLCVCVFLCSHWSLVDVPLIFFCPADHVPDWQPRVLLGMVEARSVNVKKTTTTFNELDVQNGWEENTHTHTYYCTYYLVYCVYVCVFSSHSFWASSSLDVPAAGSHRRKVTHDFSSTCRPGSSEVPRNPLTRWDVSSTPANGVFLTKKLKNKTKMLNGWRTIQSLVHKIRLHGRRGKGTAGSFSREKLRPAPQKVDEKSCVTFLLCDPGWYVQRT